jgi:hypothetical protein
VTNASPAARLCPALDRSFPLEEVPEALRHLIEDRSFDKVTLTVAHYPASAHMSVRWYSCRRVRRCLDVGLGLC